MTNLIITRNQSETLAGSGCRRIGAAGVSTLGLVCALFFPAYRALSQTDEIQFSPGDIVYADSGNAIEGGFIIKVDSKTLKQTVLASGDKLRMPFGVVIDTNGQIVISDSGRLIHVDPRTRCQTIIADNKGGKLGVPYGIDIDLAGQVVAANAQSVVRVDPANGETTVISDGSNFRAPLAVAAADNGELFVANVAFPGQIIRVNSRNGHQKVISSGGYLNSPRAIVVRGNDIYVTDVVNTNINYGVAGRVIHIDARTGTQRLVTEAQHLVDPVGITVDAIGQLIVGDCSTVNPKSPHLRDGGYDGAIIRIDPATGIQTVLVRGQGSYINPRGVAIVPDLAINAKNQ